MHTQKNTEERNERQINIETANTANTKYTGCSGSIAIETAIFLPLFIIGILTLGYLLKFCMVSEGVQHALSDESHRIMAEAVVPAPAAAAVLTAGSHRISERITNESRGEVREIQTETPPLLVSGISKG